MEIKMDMKNIPFGTTDWSQVVPTAHKGESGVAYWRTQRFDDIRVRMVEYFPGYLADHWCTKGHILCAWRESSTRSLPMVGSSS
jgi:hypothetical protein